MNSRISLFFLIVLSIGVNCNPIPTDDQHPKLSNTVYNVELYVYEFINAWYLALFPGKSGDRKFYHTSIVIEGKKYSYDQDNGVKISLVGQSTKLKFLSKETLGTTTLHFDEIDSHMEILKQEFTKENYDLFKKNCNHFTNALSLYLIRKKIPIKYFEQGQASSSACVVRLLESISYYILKELDVKLVNEVQPMPYLVKMVDKKLYKKFKHQTAKKMLDSLNANKEEISYDKDANNNYFKENLVAEKIAYLILHLLYFEFKFKVS